MVDFSRGRRVSLTLIVGDYVLLGSTLCQSSSHLPVGQIGTPSCLDRVGELWWTPVVFPGTGRKYTGPSTDGNTETSSKG